MTQRRVRVGELDFNVFDAGEGEPVLLLHGFPDSHRLWRHQVPALRAAGYRVIAPDLRGFGASAKPTEVSDYHLKHIVGDVLGLLDILGAARVRLVGHDWGAAVAWSIAGLFPQRVERLMALSVGHPTAFRNAGLSQREKSWYMLLFQFRGVSEALLQHDDWREFRDFVRHHAESTAWIADLSRDGALTAALNWYRANASAETWATGWQLPPVTVPTMGLWSTGDWYLTETQMVSSVDFVHASWQYRRLEGASHWLMLDRPDEVNAALLQFLSSSPR